MATHYDDLKFVPLHEVDVTDIVSLLKHGLSDAGATRKTESFWKWKHCDNPFGASVGFAAVDRQGKVVAVRPFMRWEFRAGVEIVKALRPVDGVVHENYRCRGIFTRLTRLTFQEYVEREKAYVFNTPNSKSSRVYLAMGQSVHSRVRVHAQFVNPLRIISSLGLGRTVSAQPAAICSPSVIGAGIDEVIDFCVMSNSEPPEFLHTNWRREFLRWRFLENPNVSYFAFAQRGGGDRLESVGWVRIERRRGLVCAFLVAFFGAGDAFKFKDIIKNALGIDVILTVLKSHQSPMKCLLNGLAPTPKSYQVFVNDGFARGKVSSIESKQLILSFADLEIF